MYQPKSPGLKDYFAHIAINFLFLSSKLVSWWLVLASADIFYCPTFAVAGNCWYNSSSRQLQDSFLPPTTFQCKCGCLKTGFSGDDMIGGATALT